MDIHIISDESRRYFLSLRIYDHHSVIYAHWALKKYVFWALRKVVGLSKKHEGISLGSQKAHDFWAPKTNVRKPPGLSSNMCFGHSRSSLGSQKKREFWAPKIKVRKLAGLGKKRVLGTKNKCKETHWALKKHEFWAPKQMSGNLLGSPETCVLGTQEFAELSKKHEFWAPKTKVRKLAGL